MSCYFRYMKDIFKEAGVAVTPKNKREIDQAIHKMVRVKYKKGVEKPYSQAGQKGPRCEAREKPTSGGVLRQYVGARRLSATKQMGLFQQSVKSACPTVGGT